MVVSLECQVIVSAMENHKQIIDSKICDGKDNKKCIIQITSENVGFIKDIILEVRTYFLDEISLEFSSLINHVLLGDGKR